MTHVLVQATHTHAGPVILDEYKSGTPKWETAALEKIGKAIAEARQQSVEARIGTGEGATYIGYNRRRVNPDGSVTMLWQNPERVPTSPIDPTVSVLRLDTADGKPLAVLVNYACHPVVFGPDNLQYSTDFPGVMCRGVELSFSEHPPMAFFLHGAPGDINPYDATAPFGPETIKKRDLAGEHLAQEAVRVAKSIKTQATPNPSLDFAEETLVFRLRWDAEKFRQGLLANYGQGFIDNFAPRITPQVKGIVSTLLINKNIAFMTMPGEPFVDYQVDWRHRCPVSDAFFLGYTNGYDGYFPTIKAASEGGYGAAGATTWVEVGAGERIVDRALLHVYEMLGRLTEVPDDLKE